MNNNDDDETLNPDEDKTLSDYAVPKREVCMCFHVPLGKITNYHAREKPKVASQLSNCLGAGTGCGWCVPFLEKIYEDLESDIQPSIKMSAEEFRNRRSDYRKKGRGGKSLDDWF